MVVIRLSRQGRKNRPFYFIVVANKSARRDGRHIEKIGSYDPLSKEIKLDMERVEHWISVGAQPSDTVKNIIKKHRSAKKEAAAS
jgi:small subunit ribosomal protein S16